MIRNNLQLGLRIFGLSLLALSLSQPAMADDIVIDESVEASGAAGETGTAGSNGTAAQPASLIDGVLTGSGGGDGEDGGDGGTGGEGADGGPVSLTTSGPTSGNVAISTDGGAGGVGGKGAKGGHGASGTAAIAETSGLSARGGDGGDAGNGGKGGSGGEGGAGGAISLTVNHDIAGDIELSAVGGDGGDGGAGGAGGNGGGGGMGLTYGPAALTQGGDGGDGGDGAPGGHYGSSGGMACNGGCQNTISPGAFGANGITDPTSYHGADGEAGAGGTITVALNASVSGGLTADAGTGDISVTLNTGASVGGTIAANEAATSALRFAMRVKSQAEYRAAKAYLGDAAHALSGSITIRGQTFTWTGFDQLVEALEFIRARAAASEASGPTYLACSPRAVTAFYKDGGIELIARRTAERRAFRIGRITGQSFSSENAVGWSVRFDNVANSVSFDVLDRAGDVVATCRN